MPTPRPAVNSTLARRLITASLVPAAILIVPAAVGAAAPTLPSAANLANLAPSTTAAAAGTVVSARKAGVSGSIVFIKGHNVWIARGDGSHARQVTKNGARAHAYHSPSESDHGVIAVARGPLIIRMTQRGRVLDTINPPRLINTAGEAMDGAVNDVAISPNGRTIAWSYVRYSCPIGADCLTRYATGYTSATHRSHAGRSTYYRAASWIGNGRTLQTGGYNSQVMLQDLKDDPRHWFDDHDYTFPSTDLADGELSRNGHWLAEVRGYRATSAIIWYRVTGNARKGAPPAVPRYTCYTNGEAAHASPTWSPDSTALAWAGKTGIWIKRNAGNCSSPAPRLAIRGGSSPDWSPARLR
ncbi:hypothetical protein [uncultured Friedmanniella sp.]|uniref:hypothetical protein n=1 Tax=uncultured Friedmanniella sp. TaxID=335381 RepID=UPI0035CA9900